MSLTLHFHPLSSFCWKVLMALYENDTPFTPNLVNLGDAAERAALLKLWPIGKFPVLRDDALDRTIPESSIIIEYLDQHYPGKTRFIAADPERALQIREKDRFYDLHVHVPMQKIITDRLRPAGKSDSFGVDQAKALIKTAYGMIDSEMETRRWAMGNEFTLADCAAAPALFYAHRKQRQQLGYLDRLKQRPTYARALKEADPYFKYIPV